jgi:hypothetical protein
MKINNRMSYQKTEGFTPIRPSTRAEAEDHGYFHSRKPSSAGNGSATSESEVSPFGMSKPPTLMRRPQYTKEQPKSEVTEVDIGIEAASLSSRRNLQRDPSWAPTPSEYIGRDRDTSESNGHRDSFAIHSPSGLASGHPADPPRPAKEGMEWVWFPEGYWAERERKELFMTEGKHKTIQRWFNRIPETRFISPFQDQSPNDSPTKTLIPRIKIGSINTRKSSSKASSRRLSERQSEPGFSSSFGSRVKKISTNRLSTSSRGEQEKSGLYSRTKKTIETRLLGKHQEVRVIIEIDLSLKHH